MLKNFKICKNLKTIDTKENQLQAFAELSDILGGNSAISSTVNIIRELERDLQKTNQRTNTL